MSTEPSSDTSDSGSSADADIIPRFADFLFNSPYCSVGSNPPSNNSAEIYLNGNPVTNPSDFWMYIRHCPDDHRFMFAQTIMNAFLNYERRGEDPIGYATTNNSSAMQNFDNTIWQLSPCSNNNPAGATYELAYSQGRAAEWLYHYMICVGTNTGISGYTASRIRRAYQDTIYPQITLAIADFYNVTTEDPTNGAWSNIDANLNGATYFTCVSGCYINVRVDTNGDGVLDGYAPDRSVLITTYLSYDAPYGVTPATLATSVRQDDIIQAYSEHINSQISNYISNYSSVLQPVLRVDTSSSGQHVIYRWSTRVYQRSEDMSHFPRYN